MRPNSAPAPFELSDLLTETMILYYGDLTTSAIFYLENDSPSFFLDFTPKSQYFEVVDIIPYRFRQVKHDIWDFYYALLVQL